MGDNSENTTNNNQDTSKPSFFGVKSYIHHFYEPVSDGFKSDYSDESDESRYLIAPKQNRRAPRIWKFAFWFGFTLLVVGSFILIFAYGYPRKQVVIGQAEDTEIVDRLAIEFNKKLDWAKIIGLAVFCCGGSLLAFTLLLPSLVGVSCLDDEDDDDTTPFKVTVPEVVHVDGDLKEKAKDSNFRIPVTEKVTSVQPSREKAESVVTESGLTQMK
ncbi:neurensin-1-like [Panonychus citri]|uniref:neurensin-1-like n=1 Tax=Panonychus citri TaxID=50023 RepID=UPI0023075A99|nr:neurensin-1-like [Panonychus citri]